MRTLSRPMFKMGGPIKEGVMHGIREPHAGGSIAGGHQIGIPMGNRTGFSDPVRKGIAKRVGAWGASKIPGFTKGWAKRAWDKYKFPPRVQQVAPPPGITRTTKAVPFMERAGQYFKKHPYLSTFGPAYLGWTDPGQKALKMAAQAPVELAQFATEALTPKRHEKYLPPNEWWAWGGPKWTPGDIRGETPGSVDNKSSDLPSVEKVLTDAEKKLIEDTKLKNAKAAKDKRVNELLEIMGYDRSKNDAVSKALIDASQIIGERGTLSKKNITRELINPIIAATGDRKSVV